MRLNDELHFNPPCFTRRQRMYAAFVGLFLLSSGVVLFVHGGMFMHGYIHSADGLSGFLVVSGIQVSLYAMGVTTSWVGLGERATDLLAKPDPSGHMSDESQPDVTQDQIDMSYLSRLVDAAEGKPSGRRNAEFTSQELFQWMPYQVEKVNNYSIGEFLRVASDIERIILEKHSELFPEGTSPISPREAIRDISSSDSLTKAVREFWDVRNRIVMEYKDEGESYFLRAMLDFGLRIKFLLAVHVSVEK